MAPRAKLAGLDEANWAQRKRGLAETSRKQNLINQPEVNAENEILESENLSIGQ